MIDGDLEPNLVFSAMEKQFAFIITFEVMTMTVSMRVENECFKRLWPTVSNKSLSLVKRLSFYCWILRSNIQTLIDTEEKL